VKFAEKIKSFFSGKSPLSDALFDDLCDLLIEGDFGAAQAYKTVERLKERCKNESPQTLPLKLAELLEEELLQTSKTARTAETAAQDRLTVILLLGVNGTGKTTTAAKLGNLYNTRYGKKPILAAVDTFRAAAVEQLKIHGERLGLRVIAHKQGGDPAAVLFDALVAAHAGGGDLIIADTAGRMHTKTALVEELRKIDRVVASKAVDCIYLKYLVLDATTGRNALAQAQVFHEAVALDGLILTKYDSTAKGGVVFSLAAELSLPVAYICTGEKYGDIELFDPHRFSKEFTGIA
jgi:fused signal recognition particle receptor